jgi:hypothetical protein
MWSVLALLALAGMIVIGLISPAEPAFPTNNGGGPVLAAERGDNFAFYSHVVQRVRHGEPYDRAALAELRALHGPVRPFLTIRPPLLAEALARLPDPRIARALLGLLTAAVVLAWTLRLRAARPDLPWVIWCALVMVAGAAMTAFDGRLILMHEAWSGLLMALSLALRTERRFATAVAVGLVAALIREFGMPYLLVMAAMALIERRRTEAIAFAVALAIALAALGLHAHAVMSLETAADPASPGWVKFSGWPFVLSTASNNLIVLTAGAWAAAVIVPLALAGALDWKDPLGLRLSVLLAGMVVGFMVFGRPMQASWGFMMQPIMAAGLCLSPLALSDLLRAASRPGRGLWYARK